MKFHHGTCCGFGESLDEKTAEKKNNNLNRNNRLPASAGSLIIIKIIIIKIPTRTIGFQL